MPSSNDISKFTKESFVSIGLATILIGVSYTLGAKLTAIQAGVTKNQESIMRVERLVDDATGDRWRASDMRHWCDALEDRNPGLIVPDVTPDPVR